MRIALVHDWFRVNAGSEKVVHELLHVFANDKVEVFTLFNKLLPVDRKAVLGTTLVHTSWLQYIPRIERLYQYLLPLLPFVIRRVNPQPFDIIFSSSHAVAKGYRKSKALHICYCHTPMRYAWHMEADYAKERSRLQRFVMKGVMPFMRRWDYRMAQEIPHFIANSEFIRQQIKTCYKKDAKVIYPPVQTDRFILNPNPRQNYYLALGRFASYKKMHLVIQAFQQLPSLKLVIIGNGDDAPRIRALTGDTPNIVWLGYQHEDELILYMQHAKACIFAAREDFGIMCVEAQATGTPVLALQEGGYLETVVDGVSGYFFKGQEVESIRDAVLKMEAQPLCDYERIRALALRFSPEVFQQNIQTYLHSITSGAHEASH